MMKVVFLHGIGDGDPELRMVGRPQPWPDPGRARANRSGTGDRAALQLVPADRRAIGKATADYLQAEGRRHRSP